MDETKLEQLAKLTEKKKERTARRKALLELGESREELRIWVRRAEERRERKQNEKGT